MSSGRLALSTPSEEYPFLLHFSGCHFLPRGFGVWLTRTVIVLHPVLEESLSASYLRIQFRKRKNGGKRDFFWTVEAIGVCVIIHTMESFEFVCLHGRCMDAIYCGNLKSFPHTCLFPLGLSSMSYFG